MHHRFHNRAILNGVNWGGFDSESLNLCIIMRSLHGYKLRAVSFIPALAVS
jgi:hypothetical protein